METATVSYVLNKGKLSKLAYRNTSVTIVKAEIISQFVKELNTLTLTLNNQQTTQHLWQMTKKL